MLYPETGQQIMTRPTSTFFFTPIRYGVHVLPALGAVVLAVNLIGILIGGATPVRP